MRPEADVEASCTKCQKSTTVVSEDGTFCECKSGLGWRSASACRKCKKGQELVPAPSNTANVADQDVCGTAR